MARAKEKQKGGRAKESLADYHAKRDFARTPEPKGETTAPDGHLRFVVQRHRARALHYDVRFEVDGVLASWAVPRGPTLDPKVRRLAVHVEDHPIEYIDFEGVIPHGEYGGGDVIVWDRGRWEPYATDDPAKAIADGELHADVFGEKLSGRFVLVRTGADRSGKEQWLMFHKRDDHAREGWDPEEHPRSVKSGRTNDEVAAEPDAEWRSDLPAEHAESRLRWAPPTADELAELDALGSKGSWSFDGQTLRLTNLDKVLFPGRDGEPPLSKRDLIRYYASVAPVLLPYLHDRPVNTRGLRAAVPDWVSTWRDDSSESHVVADRPSALAWLANHGIVEMRPWPSSTANPRRPTCALVDIDPGPEATFDDALVLARLFRTALDHLGVVGRPKVDGARGLHLWVPVEPGPASDEIHGWVDKVSEAVGATVPELLKTVRPESAESLVAPYSVRAAAGAPVSVPLEWDELDDPDLRPDGWTIRSIPDRVAGGDPFRVLLTTVQHLPDF